VVGSISRSILYLGKQAESYKVMIYAPPCLEMTVAEGVVDRNLATSLRVTARAQKKETLESNQRRCNLLLRSNTSIKRK
jgi:hypothetical protein